MKISTSVSLEDPRNEQSIKWVVVRDEDGRFVYVISVDMVNRKDYLVVTAKFAYNQLWLEYLAQTHNTDNTGLDPYPF